VPVALGLLAALLIGAADFLGARSSGRTTSFQTTSAAFLGGALAATLYSPLLGSPGVRDIVFGCLSGVALAVALSTLWRAYTLASIGVTGPIASVISSSLPVLFDATRGEAPGVLGWIGVVVGIGSLFLTSYVRSVVPVTAEIGAPARRVPLPVLLGVISGVFFALMYLFAVKTSEEAGTWPVAAQRATAFVLATIVAVVTRQSMFARGSALGWSLIAGVCGASGVAAIVYGGQRGPDAPVIVAGSMYPAVAIVLAWAFMHQPLTRRQTVGLVGALLGVALIALD
jgi:drug/metabolite transporter (DMT)-like permease